MIRDRDEDLGDGEIDFEMRRHERAEPKAHRRAAEHEGEDVAAAIGLGEVGGEPVGPAIGLLEEVDRRGNPMRLGATRAKAAPLLLDLPLAVAFGNVAGADSANAEDVEKERIFDSCPVGPQVLASELMEEGPLVRVIGGQQQGAQQSVQMLGIARPRHAHAVGHGEHVGIERGPHQAAFIAVAWGDVDQPGPACDDLRGDVAGATAAARRLPVPHRDHQVAVSDGGAAGHDIIVDLAIAVAGEFEHHRGGTD